MRREIQPVYKDLFVVFGVFALLYRNNALIFMIMLYTEYETWNMDAFCEVNWEIKAQLHNLITEIIYDPNVWTNVL